MTWAADLIPGHVHHAGLTIAPTHFGTTAHHPIALMLAASAVGRIIHPSSTTESIMANGTITNAIVAGATMFAPKIEALAETGADAGVAKASPAWLSDGTKANAVLGVNGIIAFLFGFGADYMTYVAQKSAATADAAAAAATANAKGPILMGHVV